MQSKNVTYTTNEPKYNAQTVKINTSTCETTKEYQMKVAFWQFEKDMNL